MSGEKAAWTAAAMLGGLRRARFGGVLTDNRATGACSRKSAVGGAVGCRRECSACPALSLRFHLERRTGSLTKVVERGNKSID